MESTPTRYGLVNSNIDFGASMWFGIRDTVSFVCHCWILQREQQADVED